MRQEVIIHKNIFRFVLVIFLLSLANGAAWAQNPTEPKLRKQFKFHRFLNLEGKVEIVTVAAEGEFQGLTGLKRANDIDEVGIFLDVDDDFERQVRTYYLLESGPARRFMIDILEDSNIKIDFDKQVTNELHISGKYQTLEINNLESPVNLRYLQGSLLVNSKSEVEASFSKIEEDSPISIVTTDDGNIFLYLPSDASIEVVARTISGNIYSDFDYKVIEEKYGKSGLWRKELKGVVNGGKTKVFLQATSGDISIFKRNLR